MPSMLKKYNLCYKHRESSGSVSSSCRFLGEAAGRAPRNTCMFLERMSGE